MRQQLEFTLPWPPTLNTYWRSVVMGKAARVLLSKRGRQYREQCSREVNAQRVPKSLLSGKLEVLITAYPPDRRARDLDNLPKGILDALKCTSVIRDDADIDRLGITRGEVRRDGQIHVRIREITGAEPESLELFAA